MADHVGEPSWKCFVNRLQGVSPEFAEMWADHEVIAPENLVKRLMHPQLGLMKVRYTSLWLAPRLGVRMVTYTPVDDATRAAIDRIDEVVPRPLITDGQLTAAR
jgi:hypothetical protein